MSFTWRYLVRYNTHDVRRLSLTRSFIGTSLSPAADRPLPPRNVTVSDIRADSCYLTWAAPEDNGGSDITNYIVERRDASKKKSDFEVLTVNLIDRRYGVNTCSDVFAPLPDITQGGAV